MRFEEHFAGGRTHLAWHVFPGFSPDPITPLARPDAPDGDGWVGRVTNQSLGGFASLAYAGDAGLADYTLEAWIFVDVTAEERSPLQGLAVRVDPAGQRFYRLAAQFGATPRLTLAYVGRDVHNFPIYLEEWGAGDLPGGIPAQSGWQHVLLRVANEVLQVRWNGRDLPRGLIRDARIPAGYFGVYTNFVGGEQVTQTLVDAVVVRTAG